MDLIDTALKEQGEAIGEVSSQLAQIGNDYTKQIPYAVTGGVANTYVVNSPTITALVAGMAISIKVHAASTAASTLNWNGTGAKSIKKANGGNVTNLAVGGVYTLRYDGANFILQGEGASGDATAPDLLSGKKATTDAGEITGTMPDYRGVDTTPHSFNGVTGGIYVQPKTGAYNQVGALFVEEPDFIPANFLATKNVFGLQGGIPVITGASVPATLTSSTPGDGTIRAIPPIGYYDGATGVISLYDPDYVSANILMGKNIFGVTGTSGRVASGTASASGGGGAILFTVQGGATSYFNYITVGGLTFTPSIILASATYNVDFMAYVIHQYSPHRGGVRCHIAYVKNGINNTSYECVPGGNYYVTSTGFQIPVVAGGVTYNWVAIE
jgi:hypothetical protein